MEIRRFIEKLGILHTQSDDNGEAVVTARPAPQEVSHVIDLLENFCIDHHLRLRLKRDAKWQVRSADFYTAHAFLQELAKDAGGLISIERKADRLTYHLKLSRKAEAVLTAHYHLTIYQYASITISASDRHWLIFFYKY
ncbi:hypothetical protein [Prevotella merdae]|uniref:hypothetical protein n=1 Tax=Prevotella merdae TaxID=2079531 RepID=UPI003568968B